MLTLFVILGIFFLWTDAGPLQDSRQEKRAVCAKKDVLGCDSWVDAELCTDPTYKSFMEGSCGAGCGVCTAPAIPTPPKKTGVCTKDDAYGCNQWAYLCNKDSYRAWIHKTCPATCGLCTAPSPAPPTAAVADSTSCLNAHNAKRALHGVRGMTWDARLASDAKDWALRLAKKSRKTGKAVLKHFTGGDGENLYYYGASWKTAKTCADAVSSWYDEIHNYNYKDYTKKTGKIGHFTQVVWKASTKLGAGISTVKINGLTYTFVVARYSPQGNVDGQSNYDRNVPRLI